jgi:pSer/pThr/pTyr-binding forkhead associated (FHA) protein
MASQTGSSAVNAAALRPLGAHAKSPPLPLTRLLTIVGSDERCHLHLISSTVSRQHAVIISSEDGVYVRDLASRTKVLVNGKPVREALLKNGDELQIGKFSFGFTPAAHIHASAPLPEASLELAGRTKPYVIDQRTVLIGRDADCDVAVPEDAVSTRHAIIFAAAGKRYLRDLKTRTGTFLNGGKIREEELQFGDQIRVGELRIELVPGHAAQSRAPQTAVPTPPAAAVCEAAKVETPAPVMKAPAPPIAPPITPPPKVIPSAAPRVVPSAPIVAPPPRVPEVVAEAEPELEDLAIPLEPEPAPEPIAPRMITRPLVGNSVPLPPPPPKILKVVAEPEPEEPAIPLEPAEPEPIVSHIEAPPEESVVTAMEIPLEPDPLGATYTHDAEPVQEQHEDVIAAPPLEPLPLEEEPVDEAPALEPTNEDIAHLEPEISLESQPVEEQQPEAEPTPPPEEEWLDLNGPLENVPADEVTPPAEEIPLETEVVMDMNAPLEEIHAEQSGSGVDFHSEPVAEEMPVVEEPPVFEESPVAGETSIAQEPPIFEESPVAEKTPVLEESPVVEEPPIAEEAPILEESPVAEVTPIAGLELDPNDFPPPLPEEIPIDESPAVSPSAVYDGEVLDSSDTSLPAVLEMDADLPPLAEPLATISTPGDTAFTEIVEEFSGEASGPLVEEPPPIDTQITTDDLTLESPEPEVSGPMAPPPPPPPIAPPPIIPPSRPAAKPTSTWSNNFSLDDGFFDADLTAAGVFVHGPGAKPKSSGSPAGDNGSPKGPTAKPFTSIEGLGDFPGDGVNAEHFLGGTAVPLNTPTKPPQDLGGIAVKFDEAQRPDGKSRKPPQDRFGGPTIPPPPPKARSRRVSLFGTKQLGISPDDDDAENGEATAERPKPPPGFTTAFDGLGMAPVRDVFSEFETAPTNDAAFGGAQAVDYIVPDSPQVAARRAAVPEPDFAEDEFWNRTDDQDGVVPQNKTSSPVEVAPVEPQSPEAQTPVELTEPTDESPVTPEEIDQLIAPPVKTKGKSAPAQPVLPVDDSEETGDFEAQPDAAPSAVPVSVVRSPKSNMVSAPPVPPPARQRYTRRKKKLVPLLMLAMLVCMGIVLAAIWFLIPPKSHVVGSLTYQNLDWVRGTDDGESFEAAQHRLLDKDSTHSRAREILSQQHPEVAPGFLGSDAAPYLQVVSNLTINSSRPNGVPQTLVQITLDGKNLNADRARLGAVLQAAIEGNATSMDDNRRVREVAGQAEQEVEDNQQKIQDLKTQIASLQHTIDQDPPADQFAQLEQKKKDLQKARFDAEDALDRDRMNLERLQAAAPGNGADASTQPTIADPQLDEMRQQMSDLENQMIQAKGEQTAGVSEARANLEDAVRKFNDQLTAADGIVEDGSQLKQFIDGAKDSQSKAHLLITTLIVDGEDLEHQLEETRRDVEEMIQTRQEEKWDSDPQLQSLQQNLDGAQHRYNAAVGEGMRDPKLLDLLQKDIDDWTAQVKARQATLGVDTSEVKVSDGLNKVIESLRHKLQKEKQQIDDVLDPLEKQLDSLAPAVVSLPQAQQDLAQQLRDRLSALNDARRQYSQTVGDEETSPSAQVTDLQKQIDDLKARFDRRQTDLTLQIRRTVGDERAAQLADAQTQIDTDKRTLEDAKAAYDAIRVQYDDQVGRHEDAQNARAQAAEYSQELQSRTSQLEIEIRDRDQKQSEAERSFDIKPFSDADLMGTSNDPRPDLSLYAIAGLAVIFAFVTFAASHRGATEIVPLKSRPRPAVNADEDDQRAMTA